MANLEKEPSKRSRTQLLFRLALSFAAVFNQAKEGPVG